MHRSSRAAALLLTLAAPICAAAQAAPPPAPVDCVKSPDATCRLFGQAGGKRLGRACQDLRTKACVEVQKRCAVTAYAGTATCQALEDQGAKALVDAAPQEYPNPRALPTEVDDSLVTCKTEADCKTLANYASMYAKPYDALGEWCAVRDLEQDFRGLSKRGRRAALLVCDAIRHEKAPRPDDPKPLEQVRMATVYELQKAAEAKGLRCSGFGLTLPFVRIRHPHPHENDVSGPLAAGIGGGYYFALGPCTPDWSWGVETFAFSEGLDLTKNRAQFGLGAGVGISAYKYFRFGLALGYDLYRQEEVGGVVRANGPFAAERMGLPSFAYLITLSIQTKATQPEPSPPPAPATPTPEE